MAIFFVPPGEPADQLERERQAANRPDLTEVEIVPRAPLDFDTGACLRFPQQAQTHPLQYLNGLAKAI